MEQPGQQEFSKQNEEEPLLDEIGELGSNGHESAESVGFVGENNNNNPMNGAVKLNDDGLFRDSDGIEKLLNMGFQLGDIDINDHDVRPPARGVQFPEGTYVDSLQSVPLDVSQNIVSNTEVANSSSPQTPFIATEHDRVLIVTIGTRGDLQPYVCLGNRLISAGFQVAIATHEIFRSFVEKKGPNILFFGLEGNPESIVASDEFKHAFYEGGAIEQGKVLMNAMDSYLQTNFRLTWEIASERFQATAIICGITSISECVSIGQRLLIPVYVASTVPLFPTSEFPLCTQVSSTLPFKWMNSLSYWLAFKMMWVIIGDRLNEFRTQILKLPPMDEYFIEGIPEFCMFSSLVVPRPTDWPPYIHITGYWTQEGVDADMEPSEQLVQFLAEKQDKPFYIGFGSMPLRNIAEMVQIVARVLLRTDSRGIFSLGVEAQLNFALPENLLIIRSAPHSWLLPRCCAAVHHGGAGTTAASLRAGIPTIIFPVLGDQPFWAQRVVDLGVGPPKFYPIREFNDQTFEEQVRYVLGNEKVRSSAAKLGEKLMAEDGPGKAVEMLIKNYCLHRNVTGQQLRWMSDSSVSNCLTCKTEFTLIDRRHHCRSCGGIFCGRCLRMLPMMNYPTPQKLCISCYSARRTTA